MIASAGTSLSMLEKLIPDVNDVGMISPAIKLTLQRIAQLIAMVRRCKIYLAKSTTFYELLNYHASNCILHQHIYDNAALGKGQTPSGGDHKVPAFSVSKFVGNSLEG